MLSPSPTPEAKQSAEKAWSEFKDKRCDDLDGTAYQGYVGSSAPQAYCYHKGYTSGWNAHAAQDAAASELGDVDNLRRDAEDWKAIASSHRNNAHMSLTERMNFNDEIRSLRADMDKAAALLEARDRELSRLRQENLTLRGERDRLMWIAEQYKFCGTTGCNSCENGRVTLFVANQDCTNCNPASYENPFQRPADKKEQA